MSKILNILKSRTVITLVLTFILNVVPAVSVFIEPNLMILLNTVLTALAVYFRVNIRTHI